MSYFSQAKGEPNKKGAPMSAPEVQAKPSEAPAPAKSNPDVVSVLGPAMLITGNLVCTGTVQIHGQLAGDIHAARLIIGQGAEVEGNVTAQETVIDGVFKGTIHSNSVKLQRTAVVDGEIFNKSLTIEQDAQFEGVARRLDKPVEPPSTVRAKASKPAPMPKPPTAEAAVVNGPAN
jgi:cytoskeletal protein CcmA (bactofilin family)